MVVKPTDGRHAFLDPGPHLESQTMALPVHARTGHLPTRVHLRRGFRLRGRLVRFASHRRKSSAGYG